MFDKMFDGMFDGMLRWKAQMEGLDGRFDGRLGWMFDGRLRWNVRWNGMTGSSSCCFVKKNSEHKRAFEPKKIFFDDVANASRTGWAVTVPWFVVGVDLGCPRLAVSGVERQLGTWTRI